MIKNLEKDPIEAVEIDTRHVSFEAPSGSCSTGQLINLEGYLYFQGGRQRFIATGKISGVQELNEQLCMYTIELHRYDFNLWADFRHALESTQRRVDQLFRSMRDVEL